MTLDLSPRKNDFCLGNIHEETYLKNLLEDLINRKLDTINDFKQWLLDWSELEGCVEETRELLYFNHVTNTENKNNYEAYHLWLNKYQVIFDEQNLQIKQRALASDWAHSPEILTICPTWESLRKRWEIETRLQTLENISLLKDDKNLSSRSAQIRGKQTVEWQGQEYTLNQAYKILAAFNKEDKSSTEIKELWETIMVSQAKDATEIDNIYDEHIKVRTKLATNAGFKNYLEYFYTLRGRDFSPDKIYQLHNTIETHIKPIIKEWDQKKFALNDSGQLLPWETYQTRHNTNDYSISGTQEEIITKCAALLDTILPDFAQVLRSLNQKQHLDLMARVGKMPGANSAALDRSVSSCIFSSFTGDIHDIVTLFHETGHATHAAYSRDIPFIWQRHSDRQRFCPDEACEFAAMTTELLCLPLYESFLNDKKAYAQFCKSTLQQSLRLLLRVCQIDAFEHIVYTNPHLTPKERRKAWVNQAKRFSTNTINWHGYEHFLEIGWQSIWHLYDWQLYYLTYGLAQIFALQLWKNYQNNPTDTLEKFKAALSLGGSKNISDILKTAGLVFDFSAETILDTINYVQDRLNEYENITKS